MARTRVPPLDRFLAKCRHDPVTGCVNWTGAKSMGQGHNQPYGRFWFEGKSVYAHRWSAEHILGLDVRPGLDVDHRCMNTLCVFHLRVVTPAMNTAFYWLMVQKGYERAPEGYNELQMGMPYFTPPVWLIRAPVFVEGNYPCS